MKEEDLKELITYDDIAVLNRIELLLKESGIKFMKRSFEDTAMDGLFTMALGKGKIFVYKKDYEAARNILKGEKILC